MFQGLLLAVVCLVIHCVLCSLKVMMQVYMQPAIAGAFVSPCVC